MSNATFVRSASFVCLTAVAIAANATSPTEQHGSATPSATSLQKNSAPVRNAEKLASCDTAQRSKIKSEYRDYVGSKPGTVDSSQRLQRVLALVGRFEPSCFQDFASLTNICTAIRDEFDNGAAARRPSTSGEQFIQGQDYVLKAPLAANQWNIFVKSEGKNEFNDAFGFLKDTNRDGFADIVLATGEFKESARYRGTGATIDTWNEGKARRVDLNQGAYGAVFRSMTQSEKCLSDFGHPKRLFESVLKIEQWDKTAHSFARERDFMGTLGGDVARRAVGFAGGMADAGQDLVNMFVFASQMPKHWPLISKKMGEEWTKFDARTKGFWEQCAKKHQNVPAFTRKCFQDKLVEIGAAKGAQMFDEFIVKKFNECFSGSANDSVVAECIGHISGNVAMSLIAGVGANRAGAMASTQGAAARAAAAQGGKSTLQTSAKVAAARTAQAGLVGAELAADWVLDPIGVGRMFTTKPAILVIDEGLKEIGKSAKVLGPELAAADHKNLQKYFQGVYDNMADPQRFKQSVLDAATRAKLAKLGDKGKSFMDGAQRRVLDTYEKAGQVDRATMKDRLETKIAKNNTIKNKELARRVVDQVIQKPEGRARLMDPVWQNDMLVAIRELDALHATGSAGSTPLDPHVISEAIGNWDKDAVAGLSSVLRDVSHGKPKTSKELEKLIDDVLAGQQLSKAEREEGRKCVLRMMGVR